MCMSSPSPQPLPPPPPPPELPPLPEPVEAPKRADEDVRRAREKDNRNKRNLRGDASTKVTGPRGIMAPVSTGSSTLLGGK